ncbi:Pimeloyl-ACP methyl ester carboxylesterase [Rhizobiales bacterium GAS191]|nr:Pimeloyl-ACP methyl ester carboxylesterase [Rhizobiales bacterium GAS191]
MVARDVHVPTTHGPKIHVTEWGSGSIDCVLLHGVGDGAHVWTELAARLAAHYRVFAMDLRGHGRSEWDNRGLYSVQAHSEDAAHVIETLATNPVVLIGHSLGGKIAVRLAASRRVDIAALVLVDSGPGADPAALAHFLAELNAENRLYSSTLDYASQLEAKRPLLSPNIASRLAKDSLRPAPSGGYLLQRDPALGRPENIELDDVETSWGLLEQIVCPMLLVRGRGSAILSASVAKQMQLKLRSCRLETIEVAGHAVMLDNPDGFYLVVANFLLNVAASLRA